MIKRVYVPIIGAIIGESLMVYDKILPGMVAHTTNLLIIILLIIFGKLSLETKNILQSLMLLPLSRIINLSMPQFFKDVYLQYLLICGIMLIPIYLIVKNIYGHIHEQMHINAKMPKTNYFGRFYIYALITILIWVTAIIIEQYSKNISRNMSPEIMSIGGEFIFVFLIISFSISLLMVGTKYWNKYNSDTIDIGSNPLLLTFIAIVIYKNFS